MLNRNPLTSRRKISCPDFVMVFFSIIISFLSIVFLGSLTENVSATASTLTLSVTNNISVDISSTDTDAFATSSTSANNISVTTNNGTGYTLGIRASTDNSNALINTTDSSKTIPSITTSGGISESTYRTDPSYNNTWGYKPSKINSAANSNYLPLPTSSSTLTTIDKTSVANSTANNYNLALGVKVDWSTPTGSYANTFVITAVANPAVYSITYNANGGSDTVTNMPANTSNIETYNTSIYLSSTVPKRIGYKFKGWCTMQTADGGTCPGTTYNPNGEGTDRIWTLDQTATTNTLSIYAIWESSRTVLYNAVSAMTKGTMSENGIGINDTIITPTADVPVSTNSGVFTYDGNHSDASNTHAIYYYRGILDSYGHTGEYAGSDGDNDAFPNTVVLSVASDKSDLTSSNATCWRIVRTTGSGGIKMIYSGKWRSRDGCKNYKNTVIGISTSDNYYNRGTETEGTDNNGTKGYATYVGYNYNSTYAYGNTSYTSLTSNSLIFNNSTESNIRNEIEKWYSSNMTTYTNKLETSAGWCNDRTTYKKNYNSFEATTENIPYSGGSSSFAYDVYFGAYYRLGLNSSPTLQCPDITGNDLLTTSNGLSYPVALLTADEGVLAGNGYNGKEAYSYKSYLYSGYPDGFWTLSPFNRYNWQINVGVVGLNLSGTGVYNRGSFYHVRPSISLKSGTSSISGSGTAQDPWIVNP